MSAALDTIVVLWRQPDTLALWGIPYAMREGQSPGDLWRAREAHKVPRPGHYGSQRIDLSDWICLGWPGWWGSIPREEQAEIKTWLDGREVPQNPCEWTTVDRA